MKPPSWFLGSSCFKCTSSFWYAGRVDWFLALTLFQRLNIFLCISTHERYTTFTNLKIIPRSLLLPITRMMRLIALLPWYVLARSSLAKLSINAPKTFSLTAIDTAGGKGKYLWCSLARGCVINRRDTNSCVGYSPPGSSKRSHAQLNYNEHIYSWPHLFIRIV